MKKGNLILTVFCITLLAMITGCGGRGGQAEPQVARGAPVEQVNYEEWIQGTWRFTLDTEYRRLENGVVYDIRNGRNVGRYEIEGNIITFYHIFMGNYQPEAKGTLNFNGRDRFTINDIRGLELEFVRQREP